MTGNPAQRTRSKGRGRFGQSSSADIIGFDAEWMGKLAPFQAPRIHPADLPLMIVAGQATVGQGRSLRVAAGDATA